MENWERMVEVLCREEEEAEKEKKGEFRTREGTDEGRKAASGKKKGGWFWSGQANEKDEEKWAREANAVKEKVRELRMFLREEGLAGKAMSVGDGW